MDKRVIVGAVVILAVLLMVPLLPKVLKRAPTPDPAADSANEQRIQQAIQAYAARTGVFPPMLEALIPNYLEAIPPTSTGGQFVYDPQSGTVRNPNPVVVATPSTPPPSRGGGRPVGGGGPMGEAMTGIGVANELR